MRCLQVVGIDRAEVFTYGGLNIALINQIRYSRELYCLLVVAAVAVTPVDTPTGVSTVNAFPELKGSVTNENDCVLLLPPKTPVARL